MANNSYFQRAARQFAPSMPVLAPPRYLTRRLETGTGQFDGFEPVRADFSRNQVLHQPMPQTSGGQNRVRTGPLELQEAGSMGNGASPPPASATKSLQFADAEVFSLGDTAIPATVFAVGPSPSAAAGGSHANLREHTGHLPAVPEISPQSESATAQLSTPLPSDNLSQPAKHFAFPTERREPVALDASAESRQGTGFRWQAPVPESGVGKDAEKKDAAIILDTAKRNATETESASPSAPKIHGLSLGPTETVNPQVATGADFINPGGGKTPNATGSPPGMGQDLTQDNTEVRIGTLDITVVSPAQATGQPQARTVSSRLSLARGVSRGFGLKQG
jgi:hypothetical protein